MVVGKLSHKEDEFSHYVEIEFYVPVSIKLTYAYGTIYEKGQKLGDSYYPGETFKEVTKM